MKRIISFSLAVLALLLTGACQRMGTIYEIPEGSACVSFPSKAAKIDMLPSDGNKFTVELWRGNTKGAASVAVDIDNQTNGAFTPSKQAFEFADGEAVAKLDFTYPDLNNFGGEAYKIVLNISDAKQVSPSGISKMTITAQRKLTRVFLGTGLFYSAFFDEQWEQDLYTTIESPDYYILPDCWVKGKDWTFTVSGGKPKWPATFDTGYLFVDSDNNSYGDVWVKTGGTVIQDGAMYLIVDSYYLPEFHNYDFGNAYEAFLPPEGVKIW